MLSAERRVDNHILYDGWAFIPTDEVCREAARTLLPDALAVIDAMAAVRQTAAYQELYEQRSRSPGHLNFIDPYNKDLLIFESLYRDEAGFTRVGYSSTHLDTPLELRGYSIDPQLLDELYDIRHSLARVGARALNHFGIEIPTPLFNSRGHTYAQSFSSDIRIRLMHYAPDGYLPSDPGKATTEGHRDFVKNGVAVSWQLSKDLRTWGLGYENNLVTKEQARGDSVWLDARSTRTRNPNPYHTVSGHGVALLFNASHDAAERFDAAFQDALAA